VRDRVEGEATLIPGGGVAQGERGISVAELVNRKRHKDDGRNRDQSFEEVGIH
jgi:hypothetical protein